MAQVIANMSMSLDGYVADENDGINEVFAWFSSGPVTLEMANGMKMQMSEKNAAGFRETIAQTGAVLTGRRTSDLAGAWGGQHPVGAPAYVVTHRPPPEELDPETSSVHFVDDVEEAVRQAKEAAGDKVVGVAGGDMIRQLLALGLLDGITVSVAPVLLGSGVPFFPNLANAPIHLEGPEVTEGDGVTHLSYTVVR